MSDNKPDDKPMTPAQALAYIAVHLPDGEKWPTDRRAYQHLDYHRRHGNVEAVTMYDDRARKSYRYTQAALDAFLASRRHQGTPWSDISAIEDRLGIVPDAVLAREAGISQAAVWRARNKRGIPAVGQGRPKGKEEAKK